METGDAATAHVSESNKDGPLPLAMNQQANEVSKSKTASVMNKEKNECPLLFNKDTDGSACASRASTEKLNSLMQTAARPQAKSSFSICTGDLKRTKKYIASARNDRQATASDHSKSSGRVQSDCTSNISPNDIPSNVDTTDGSLTSLLSATSKSNLETPSHQVSSVKSEKAITVEKDNSSQVVRTQSKASSSRASQLVTPGRPSEGSRPKSGSNVLDCCRWVGESRQGSSVLHFNKAYMRVMPSSRCQFTPVEVQSFLETRHAARRYRHYDQPSRVLQDFNMCAPHLLGPRRVLSQTRGSMNAPYFQQSPSDEEMNRPPSEQILSSHCLGPGRGRNKTARRRGLGVGAVEILLNHNSPMEPQPKGRRLVGPLAEHICTFQESKQ